MIQTNFNKPPERLVFHVRETEFSGFCLTLQEVLRAAEKKHPKFPVDPLDCMAIIMEELGEATQAAIDFRWLRHSDYGKIRQELYHTAAMCVRTMAMLDILQSEDCRKFDIQDEETQKTESAG